MAQGFLGLLMLWLHGEMTALSLKEKKYNWFDPY